MLTCKDITTEAQLLIDGELGWFKALRVRFHLMICQFCRRYVEQLKLTLGVVKDDRLSSVPDPTESEIDDVVAHLKSATQKKR